METETKLVLEETLKEINKAVDETRRKRNEEDRRYIVSAIGRDLAEILKPLLTEIAKSSKMSREEVKSIIQTIKSEVMQINVPAPQVTVNPPEVKIPKIIVPTPQVTVKAPEVRMPKEMEVKGLTGMLKMFGDALKQKLNLNLGDINRDHPMPVQLVDDKGISYKAMATLISGGGGGPRIITIKEAVMAKGADTVGSGNVTTSAGTAKRLSSVSIPCKRVIVHAVGGHIVVGGSDVDYTEATRKGIWLAKTQRETFYVNNVNLLYVDSAVNVLVGYYYEN